MNERAEQRDKPDEIIELTDRYFFRPAGSWVANVAHGLRLSPTQVTIGAALVGVIGGTLLYSPRLGWLGFAFLVAHGVFDSADGQLARKTGQTSELGRVLDGVAGYVMHIAMFIALTAGYLAHGGSRVILLWCVLAGISTIAQAQAYDYYRTTYSAVVNARRVRRNEPKKVSGWLHKPYEMYSAMQRFLVGSHEQVIAKLSDGITEEERQRYRATYRPLVRGWNLLGDNSRRYATAATVLLQSFNLLFVIIVLPMNLIFVGMTIWQRRADRRFLRQE